MIMNLMIYKFLSSIVVGMSSQFRKEAISEIAIRKSFFIFGCWRWIFWVSETAGRAKADASHFPGNRAISDVFIAKSPLVDRGVV